MQTFITDSNPIICAKHLDNKRLGKQRVEAFQILNTIEKGGGWSNHPCVKMWIGHELSLKYYFNSMVDEWIWRGFKNTMVKYSNFDIQMPWWFSLEPLQKSHRAALLRKNSNFYKNVFQIENIESSDLIDFLDYKYIWPSKLDHNTLIKLQNGEILPLSSLAEKL